MWSKGHRIRKGTDGKGVVQYRERWEIIKKERQFRPTYNVIL